MAIGKYSLRAKCRTICSSGAGRRGFTLLEVMISLSLLGVVSALAMASLSEALDAGRTVAVTGQVRSEAETIVQRIARDIRYSGTDSTGWSFPADTEVTSIAFSVCTGWNAATGQRTWGPVIRYWWEVDAAGGETEDGTDNNGNGVVDEGNLYCQRGGGAAVLLGRNVERGTLLFLREDDAQGSTVTIRVGVVIPNRSHPGSAARGVYETTVSLRN